jgi:hypothetical protein
MKIVRIPLAIILIVVAGRTLNDGAQTETNLYSFGGSPDDGVNPEAVLAQGSDGNFDGTTYQGGTNNSIAVTPVTFAANRSHAKAKIDQPVAWELCAPCILGGYVDILGQRSVRINIKHQSPNCASLIAIYNDNDAYAVFPDGSIGTVTGLESCRFDYCHSHKFRIHAFFNITDHQGNTYHCREVREGNEGDPVQIGWDCDGFSCGGKTH